MARNRNRNRQQSNNIMKNEEIEKTTTAETAELEENTKSTETNDNANESGTNDTTQQQVIENNEQKVEKETEKPTIKKLSDISTLDELFDNFKQDPKLKDFVILINIFYNKLKGPEKDNPEIIVPAQYNFFNALLKHLNTNNYGEFKTKFDILLKAFVLGKNTPFNIINIVKFDHYWKYSTKSRVDYYTFMTFLDAIANPKDRRNELKRLKLEKLNDHIPENVYRHITRYLNK